MKTLQLLAVTLLPVFSLFLPMGIASDVPFADIPFDVNSIPEPVPPPQTVRDFFGFSPFYQQWVNVEGFPVLSSENVNPYALKEAAWLIWHMTRHRRDLLQVLAQNRVRFSITAHNELSSDIPELTEYLVPHFFYNVRGRGGTCPFTCGIQSDSEEQLLGSHTYSVLIHEFTHTLHHALKRVDPAFDNWLSTTYNAAMEKGLWADTYAASNRDEYLAEAVGSWFHAAEVSNLIKTRDALKVYDPSLALLIAEIFGDYAWRYTPLAMRTHLPHLQGFDPRSAPKFTYPPGVLEAYEELYNPAIHERDEWVNLPPYDPSLIPILNESRIRGDRTDILFVNLSGAEVLLYRVHLDGTEIPDYRFPPNPRLITQFTIEVDGLLLAKDSTGRNIAVFQAVEKVGRALVGPALNLITPGLLKISGDNQTGVSSAVLANPFVIEVRDADLSVLEGISVTFTVIAGDGTLSVTRTMTDKNGRAESVLTLGSHLGTNTVSVSAEGIEGTVIFNAVAAAAVDIPDPNLRTAIKSALGKTSGVTITMSDMARLAHLDAQNANISDLTGLQFATNLTELLLGAVWVEGQGWSNSNTISDLSPLLGLTNLTRLELRGNTITDISPLVGLTNLIQLSVEDNSITDISQLSGLTSLTELELFGNSITDISPLSGLTNLTWLQLFGNNIRDLTPLSGLTNLTRLALSSNGITDISPLSSLTNLKILGLANNNISNLSPIAGFTHLTRLGLRGNNISDLSSVVGLVNLERLDLRHNYISNISPLVANTGLGGGDEVLLNDNPLNTSAINSDVPTLKRRGVKVEFDDRLPITPPSIDTNGKVRLVYFVPSNRSARSDAILRLRNFITEAQQFFANEMERHGYGRKTFTIETDNKGQPIVHQIRGKFEEDYYNFNPTKNPEVALWEELVAHFDDLHHVFFVLMGNRRELIGKDACGIGGPSYFTSQVKRYGYVSKNSQGGFALRHRDFTPGDQLWGGMCMLPDSPNCFGDGTDNSFWGATLHELGHTLGIEHDFRHGINSDYVMGSAGYPSQLSKCAAEWLEVSPFFNTKTTFHDEPGEIQFPSLRAYSQDVINFRFEVTDPDGLHQAQLLVPTVLDNPQWAGLGAYRLFDCKRLNGKTGSVESAVSRAELVDRITLQIIDVGGNVTWATFPIELDTITPPTNGDINGDGSVNVLDLIVIASKLGDTGTNIAPDISGDGVVNVLDLVLVAGMFESAAAAPSTYVQTSETLTAVVVRQWLIDARALEVSNPIMQRGIMVLEHLLVFLTPKETQLLANYPNPFNPETWIPYQLAKSADVQLTIYDIKGEVVHRFSLGHQTAGYYTDRTKAAYWEGRNDNGESVASGVYFYHLSAGNYSATRRMLVLK